MRVFLQAMGVAVSVAVMTPKLAGAASLVQSPFVSQCSAGETAEPRQDRPAVSREKLKNGSESITTPYGEYIITGPEFDKDAEETNAGIGVRVTKQDEGLVVADLFPGSPAEKVGLKKADVITAINLGSGSLGETKHMSLEAAINSLRGKAGTAVTLRVYRPKTKKTLNVTIIRSSAAFSGAKPEHSTWQEVPLREVGQKRCPERWKDCYLITPGRETCSYSCPRK